MPTGKKGTKTGTGFNADFKPLRKQCKFWSAGMGRKPATSIFIINEPG